MKEGIEAERPGKTHAADATLTLSIAVFKPKPLPMQTIVYCDDYNNDRLSITAGTARSRNLAATASNPVYSRRPLPALSEGRYWARRQNATSLRCMLFFN